MRRFLAAVLAVALLAIGALSLTGGASPASALHGVFLAHVHDDYFHPTGSFVPGPGHATAQALCMGATPDPTCTSTIHTGDAVRWVAPAPLAVNAHSVTECTDATYSVCGAGLAAGNPIEDSGVRFQPGWPYQVSFPTAGTYYYRCDVHPAVMRGIVQVNDLTVGGVVDILGADSDDSSSPYLLATLGAGIIALAAVGIIARRRLASSTAPTE